MLGERGNAAGNWEEAEVSGCRAHGFVSMHEPVVCACVCVCCPLVCVRVRLCMSVCDTD